MERKNQNQSTDADPNQGGGQISSVSDIRLRQVKRVSCAIRTSVNNENTVRL